MSIPFSVLIRHAASSIANPRAEARWVMNSFDLNRVERWQAVIANTVIATLFAWVWTYFTIGDNLALLPPLQKEIVFTILTRPFVVALLQSAVAVLTVFSLYWVGRIFGGQGGFGNAISLVAWMLFVLNCVSALQIFLLFVIPVLASVLGALALVFLVVMLTVFCAELHGFKSLLLVFLMSVVTFFGVLFGVSVFLTMIGVLVPGAA